MTHYSNKEIKYSLAKESRKNGNKSSSIRIENKSGIVKLGNYIYDDFKDNNIGLARKYNKFIDIRNATLSKSK